MQLKNPHKTLTDLLQSLIFVLDWRRNIDFGKQIDEHETPESAGKNQQVVGSDRYT